ncbi:MAG: dTDP-4-dehydrorhamnose 3,5-epimerase [Desulfobulbaceae bacterium]|jgi:dTDP-4-dehydrorhamnose 3,5-epimerase|nr:dTDP-4-dehydrorhamnose 3,5-epimerase [Desulfobulbaceae bacterium]
MRVIKTMIDDVLLIEPKVFGDQRGFFMESFNFRAWKEQTGIEFHFAQANHSRSSKGVLRGIHYQLAHPQGKLVRVVNGTVFDVAVDLRKNSPTFGRWVGEILSADNKRQLWVPERFGHAFFVMSEFADFLYETTDYYHPEDEHCLLWNDPTVGIVWPLDGQTPLMSEKDLRGKPLSEAAVYE